MTQVTSVRHAIHQVPVLEDGDELLLGFPEEENLPIYHGILETLQARMDWLQSGKLQVFTSPQNSPEDMKDRSDTVQEQYADLISQLTVAYQERYGSTEPLLTKQD